MNDLDDPAAALDSIRASQSALADRVSRGGWLYDLAYSALVSGMVFGWAFPMPVGIVATAACIALLALMARMWTQHHGVWISGVTPRGARWVAIALAAVVVPLIVVNLIGARETWPAWVAIATTAAAFVLALAASRLWRVVYRRENGLQS